MFERSNIKTPFLHHYVKRAKFAAMAPEHIVNVKRAGPKPGGNPFHFGRGYEQEHGTGVNKPPDQPRTSNAVNFWPRPRYPDRAPLRIPRGQFGSGHTRQTGFGPAEITAFEVFSQRACMAQISGNTFTEFKALLADGHHVFACIFPSPCRYIYVGTADCAGDQIGIGLKILMEADIKEDGAIGRANQARKFISGNRIE